LVAVWALVPLCLFSVARTQHHWYLDPTYPAWAMLAAIGLLKVMGCLRSERARFTLLALTALALVGCELRLIARVGLRDQMPESQRFLASFAQYPALRHAPLYAASPLSYAERFLLQVVDGFDVQEAASSVQTANDPLPTTGLILVQRRSNPPVTYCPCIGPQVIAQNEDYLLVEGREPRCVADRNTADAKVDRWSTSVAGVQESGTSMVQRPQGSNLVGELRQPNVLGKLRLIQLP
jgi:hypothetical protein